MLIHAARTLLGIQTKDEWREAGRRWATSELDKGENPDDLLDAVACGLSFDGPNAFDEGAREVLTAHRREVF